LLDLLDGDQLSKLSALACGAVMPKTGFIACELDTKRLSGRPGNVAYFPFIDNSLAIRKEMSAKLFGVSLLKLAKGL
jgi:hypothetical protein